VSLEVACPILALGPRDGTDDPALPMVHEWQFCVNVRNPSVWAFAALAAGEASVAVS